MNLLQAKHTIEAEVVCRFVLYIATVFCRGGKLMMKKLRHLDLPLFVEFREDQVAQQLGNYYAIR